MTYSLRRRLSLTFFLLTTFALLALAASILITTKESEDDLVDEVVNATCNGILALPTLSQPVLQANIRLFHAPAGQIPQGLAPEIARMPVGNHEWFDDDIEYHIGVRERQNERIYVLYDTRDHETRLRTLLITLGVGIVSLSLISVLLAHLLSGRLLAQLSHLAEQVRDDLPIDTASGLDREVALLAHAIQTSRTEKAALLEREREFTSHVGHEVRTPLTRIRTSAELLAEVANDEVTTRRTAQIIAAADDLETKLRGLLFLARETRLQTGTLDLALAANAALQRFENLKPDLARVQEIPPGIELEADPNLLALLLDNLLSNALRHTEHGQIRISLCDDELQVSDTGSGIAPEKLPRVFERHYRASTQTDGQGLGLAIVARVCELSDWHYTIASELGRGTTVRIALHPHKKLT